MNNRRSIILVPVALALLVAVFYGLTKSRPKPQPPVSQTIVQEKTGVPVQVARVVVNTVSDTLEVTGQLSADSITALSTKQPGKVVSVAARQGDRVNRGELLIQLDDVDARRQLEQAQAGVRQAQAGLRTAQARLSQARTAVRVGDTQSEAAVASAQAVLRAARARLEQVTTGARRQERAQAENAVAIARASLDKAQSDYNRYKALFDQGAIPAASLDAFRTQLDVARSQYNNATQAASLVEEGARTEEVRQAEAAVRQAEEGLRSARAATQADAARREDVRAAQAGIATAQAALESARAAVGIAEQNVANFKIFAPRSGSVIQRNVEPGQWASPGAPLMTIVDLDTVYLQATVSETDVARVQADMAANVRLEAFPNKMWTGRVQSVVPSADAANRTFTARVHVNNQGHLLKPNMFARAAIVTGTVEDAMLVPKQAVITRQGNSSVVRVENGEAEVISVITGITSGNNIVVRSPALHAGDNIVTEGAESLNTGQKVVIV